MKFITPGELKFFFIAAGIIATLAGIITFIVVVLTAPPPEEKRLPMGNPFFEKNPVLTKKEVSLMDFVSLAPMGQISAFKPPLWREIGHKWTDEDVKQDFLPPEKLEFYTLPEKAEKEFEDFVRGLSP